MQTMLLKKYAAVKPSPQTKSHTSNTVQAAASATDFLKPDQPRLFHAENRTGMPDQLKTQIEQMSGYSMEDVRVHYNSGKPAQLQALAYTQGTDIHIAPRQEQHLAHEAWHVVQQKQGRVAPTMYCQGIGINDNDALEHEADVMGAQALRGNSKTGFVRRKPVNGACIQRHAIATLVSGSKSEFGKSDAYARTDLIKEDPAVSIIETFKGNVRPMDVGDQKLRPIFQCAEPKALIKFLARFNDDIDMDLIDNLKFESVIENVEDESGEKREHYMSPCNVCRQWVEDNRGRNERVKKEVIIPQTGLDLSKSNNQRAEEEQQERLKRQSEAVAQKKQVLSEIRGLMDNLLCINNTKEVKPLLEYAFQMKLTFSDDQGIWLDECDIVPEFNGQALEDRINEDDPEELLCVLTDFRDQCQAAAASSLDEASD